MHIICLSVNILTASRLPDNSCCVVVVVSTSCSALMHGYGGDMSIMAALALFIVVLQCVYLAERRREKGGQKDKEREKKVGKKGGKCKVCLFFI